MDVKQIAEGCKGSEKLQMSKDGKSIRRIDNSPLPALTKKRDQKAKGKEMKK